MPLRIAAVTLTIAAIAAVMFSTHTSTPLHVATVATSGVADSGSPSQKTEPSKPQPFVDNAAVAKRFADELGRMKEEGQTVSPAELARQATAENSYTVSPLADPGKRLDAETVYASAKPGVVAVGGIFKCGTCKHWHIRCASGFVVRRDGLIVTNYHVVDGYKDKEALGVMTADGRVLPVKAVLAANQVNDVALLKVDATDLHALPVCGDVPVGATAYCLSHPTLPGAAGNGFFAFSKGTVGGKFVLHVEKNQTRKALVVTVDYGPGSSGGPILNEHGAVVGLACQAIPLGKKEKEHDVGVQMIWRFARPADDILAMLSKTTSKQPPEAKKPAPPVTPPTPQPATPPKREAEAPQAARPVVPAGGDGTSFELKPCDLPSVGFYRPVRVELTEDPPMKPKAEPKYASKPLYGVLRLGDAAENRFLVALDEPTSGEPKIHIDRDGSGDLTHGPGDWQRNRGGTSFLNNVAIDVPYTTGKIPYKFTFYRMKARLPNTLLYYRSSGREGHVTLDGRRYRVLVLDDNADGRFDDLKSGTLFIDLNQDDKLDTMPDSAECYKLDEPFNVRGNVWEVASLSADGLRIALRRSKASVPIKAYLEVGYQAPAFTGRGLDGKPIDLKTEAAKGHYVLIDFWASWCGPCRGEFPNIRRAHAQYKDHGLTIVGVNLDSNLDKAKDAASQAKLNYPHVFDGREWQSAVAQLYRVHSIPQVYLLDRNLKIVGKNLRGPMLEKRLRELLGAGDEAAAKAIDAAMPPTKPKPKKPTKRPGT
jgi:thiol-disulfide isomerase/thioredoxin